MRTTLSFASRLFYEPQEDELAMHRDPGDVSLDMGLSEEAAQAGIACAFLISADFRSTEKTNIRQLCLKNGPTKHCTQTGKPQYKHDKSLRTVYPHSMLLLYQKPSLNAS